MTPSDLKKIRVDLKLSLPKMAEKLGISRRFYCYRESGDLEIPIWMARAARDLKKYRKAP